VIAILPLDSFLDYLAIRVDGAKLQSLSARIDWVLEDEPSEQRQCITLSNGALNHRAGSHGPQAELTIRTTRTELVRLSAGRDALADALANNSLRTTGRVEPLQALIDAMDEFDALFNVVEP
jgi:alkyl sulfatase BDS1-like metallo-beta-lactamase superfamily hydrolase